MQIQISERLKKLPAYAFKEINDKVAALRESGVKAIDFGVGDPSEPTPDFVIESLCEAGKKHATTGYPSYIGSGEFRQAAADYMRRRFGVELDPETEISSNIGSKEAVFNFPEGFINPGDLVIVPSPGYPPMKTGTWFAEGEVYFVPLLEKNKFLLDFEAIPSEVATRAKIIWINYPNSPTGAVADRGYYERLIAWAHKHEIIIAADEGCYIDIYRTTSEGDRPVQAPISILEVAREGIVAFYSMSKRNNMTGYRTGFLCGDAAVIDVFKKLKTNIDSGTPSVMQEAAIIALNDDEHVAKMREVYEEKLNILLPSLESVGCGVRRPEATFYVWARVPSGMSDVEFATKLLDPSIGIVVTPGSLISDECELADGTRVNPGAGYVRFALMPTLEEVKEAAQRLQNIG